MKKAINILGKIVDLIEKICMGLSTASVIAMMLLVTTDVTGRKFFDAPVPGSVELIEDYLMITLVYLAMSYVYTQGGHVRVVLFRKFIPVHLRSPVDVVLNVLAFVFFALVAGGGLSTALRALKFKEYSSCILAYPMAPAYFILTLGSIFLCIRIFETIISPQKINWHEQ